MCFSPRSVGGRQVEDDCEKVDMSTRPLIIATLVGATVGVPYLASRNGKNQSGASGASAATNAWSPTIVTPSLPAAASNPPPNQYQGIPTTPNTVPPDGTKFQSVDQVFRFDVTKEWVYRNWPRKSTGPTDVGLFSVRVPLVMGTQSTALAGSLTYYFNSQGQVEHISFRGRTGDTTQLVYFIVKTYALERVESYPGEQVYRLGRGKRVQSELRTRPEPVLNSTSPQSSFSVELELACPGSRRYLPPRGTGLQVPQVAATANPTLQSTAAPPAATGEKAGAAKPAANSYFDKVRYATPAEEKQLLSNRWPN
jgi:hypothetical protein